MYMSRSWVTKVRTTCRSRFRASKCRGVKGNTWLMLDMCGKCVSARWGGSRALEVAVLRNVTVISRCHVTGSVLLCYVTNDATVRIKGDNSHFQGQPAAFGH